MPSRRTTLAVDGKRAAAVVRDSFAARGITFSKG